MRLTAGLIKVLLLAAVIPAFGYGVGHWIMGDLNAQLAADQFPPYGVICSNAEALASPEVQAFCDEFRMIALLRPASVLAALIGVSIPLLYWLASTYTGADRNRIARVFPPLVRLSLMVLTLTVLAQGIILTYAVYVWESYALGTVHYVVIAFVGLGALAAAWKLFTVSFSFGKNLETHVVGTALRQEDEPGLFAFVGNLASTLGAKPPDNIVVGLDPTFYVTSCAINLVGQERRLTGETLYLSAPLCRLMRLGEVSAIIGHELGHFRGEDTVYSLRFAPVYAGLGNAIGAVAQGGNGLMQLARLPAISMLSFMYDVFARNQAEISRVRELVADKAGISASSPMDLATSLVKVTLYSGLWQTALEHNVARLSQGKFTRNLSHVFQGFARYDVEHESLEEIMKSVLDQQIVHPTDTHPTLAVRMANAGVRPDQIDKAGLLVPEDSAVNMIKGHKAIEEDLTALEHRFLAAMGVVAAADGEQQQTDYLLHATYHLAAAMVAADGHVEPEEIAVAERIGGRMFDDFDPIDFRDCCNHPDELPDPVSTSGFLNGTLSQDQKVTVMRYLNAIAAADGEVADSEFDLLGRIADALGIDRSMLSRNVTAN
ncbi:MAG: M48 family metalloprotease [Alphaproteobacteria bacterium]|nr:M48 family metalloprotease [Alphaproteobacteria bacterium]